jgi:hypothetical protein
MSKTELMDAHLRAEAHAALDALIDARATYARISGPTTWADVRSAEFRIKAAMQHLDDAAKGDA